MSGSGSRSGARGDITAILKSASEGSRDAMDRLIPLVYEELRLLARARMRGEGGAHTLQTTALVHEAFVRLVQTEAIDLQSRRHFFALAARTMRRVLVDHARSRGRQKRGGGATHLTLDEARDVGVSRPAHVLDLHEALERLAEEDERKALVVELRFFGGLGVREAAEVMGVSASTVERHWVFARAWLHRELKDR
jgi:RNA polymerase sigma factor (TIGR02999 family)